MDRDAGEGDVPHEADGLSPDDVPPAKRTVGPEQQERLRALAETLARAAAPDLRTAFERFSPAVTPPASHAWMPPVPDMPEIDIRNTTPQRQLKAAEAMVDALAEILKVTAEQRDLIGEQRDLIAEQRDIAVAERDEARADRAEADKRSRTALLHSWWALAGTWIAVIVAVITLVLRG